MQNDNKIRIDKVIACKTVPEVLGTSTSLRKALSGKYLLWWKSDSGSCGLGENDTGGAVVSTEGMVALGGGGPYSMT